MVCLLEEERFQRRCSVHHTPLSVREDSQGREVLECVRHIAEHWEVYDSKHKRVVHRASMDDDVGDTPLDAGRTRFRHLCEDEANLVVVPKWVM